jgi:hypothetical protein
MDKRDHSEILVSFYQNAQLRILGASEHHVHHNNDLKVHQQNGFRERTIPTERPPLVGEVIANFCG